VLSVIVPARNEELAIVETVRGIRQAFDGHQIPHEIIVVDDGSTDRTGELARGEGAIVIRHPESGGYGKSLKAGILRAKFDLIAITDADGTYPNQRLPDLYKLVVDGGFDMAVGARTGSEYRGTFLKMPARSVFLWLSEYATGRKIDDINSGLRVFKKELVLRYMHTIGDKFSFTTTITLAAMLNGHFVCYTPIEYFKRVGKSHIRYWRDSLRSLQIIVENILYYNPLKLFLLLVNLLVMLSAAGLVALFFLPQPAASWAGWLSAICLPSALIVAAIGLAADLGRMTRLGSRH
jgi:glycosyltransferase involved in cell wall biosynthesis